MMMTQPAAPTVSPNLPLTVRLEAQQWNSVIALLQEVLAPNRVTTPLIQAISEQLQLQVGQSQEPPRPPLGNGLDLDAPHREEDA